MMGMIESDLTGIHQQHAAAQTSFNDMLRLVVLLEALPWLTAGTLVTNNKQFILGSNFFKTLPEILIFALYFSGIAGLVGLQILVHNRLNIIFYARAINGFRKIYSKEFPEVGNILPVKSHIPPARDCYGIMALVAVSLASVNSFYLSLAFYNHNNNNLWFAIAVFLLILLLVFCLYMKTTQRFIIVLPTKDDANESSESR